MESSQNIQEDSNLISQPCLQRDDSSSGSEEKQSLNPEELDEYHNLSMQFDVISKNNVAKNIIKAFFVYLLDVKNNDLLSDLVAGSQTQVVKALKIAKNYQKSFQYNNLSLQKLIQHPKYGKALEFYLTFEAESWLVNSKVLNKQNHLVFIDFLKLCCSNIRFSKHIVTYKRNKLPLFNAVKCEEE